MTAGVDWLVPLLVCPACRRPLRYVPDEDTRLQGILDHEVGCRETYPVIEGVPRLLTGAARPGVVREHMGWFAGSPARRALAARWSAGMPSDRQMTIVRAFDFEWALHDKARTAETSAVFELYFDLVPQRSFAADRLVLDAGCGAGRWALEVAARGPRVIAVDLGSSIDIARRNAGSDERVACVQADLRDLPLRDGAVDWAYSLGVLHHVIEPERALRRIGEVVRPGGLLLVYLYYALDGRGRGYRSLFRLVDGIRAVTSRMPRPIVRAFATAVAVAVYWPSARLSALLVVAGMRTLADALPLSFYRDRTLATMLNDSLDRFGTRLERRYSRSEVVALLNEIGAVDVRVSSGPPYWHAVATLRP